MKGVPSTRIARARPEPAESLRRHVFSLFTTRHPARHIGVHACEIRFVDFRESAGIALRRLDQAPLVGLVLVALKPGLR
jgi:hypothetical protein